mgnify:CR=1 FL=1
MPSWNEMNAEEQKALMKNIMQIITASGVAGISVVANELYSCNPTEGKKYDKS